MIRLQHPGSLHKCNRSLNRSNCQGSGLRKMLAVNIMGVGVFMLLLSTANRGDIIDPVPHAMVLTGIVVAVAGTALCLKLAVNISKIDQSGQNVDRQ